MAGPLQSQITLHVGRAKWGEKPLCVKLQEIVCAKNDLLLTRLVKNKSLPPCAGLKTHWLLKEVEPKCFQYLLQKM